MALMRTSRKATTGPGDPKKKTGIKPKVTTTPEVTVTGKMEKDAYKMTAKEQFDKYASNDKWSDTFGDIGRKTKTSRLSAEELKAFRKSEREGQGSKLIPKEVRVSPTVSAKDRKSGDNTRLGGYQVDYYDPGKDKAVYEADSRQRYAEEGSPVMKTRKLAASTPSRKLEVSPKRKEIVSKAIEGPSGQGRSFKKKGSVTGRLKSQGGLAGGAEGRKFRKEEKLAGAYTRSKKYANQNTPEDVRKGANVAAGAFSKEKKAGYKSLRSDIKSEMKGASKLPVSAEAKAGYKKELKGALKDTRKSQKFEKKEQAGKTKYFNKSKMNETVEKRPSMKGRMQAGKMRYS